MSKEISFSFAEHKIYLTQRDDGVLVEQNGKRYLARGWKLNKDLIDIIGEFLDSGFTCLIRIRHPQQNNRARGVDYIGFSSDESSPWLAVVDKSSKQCPVNRITVNSLFRDLLTAARVPFNWETAGGKNMFVARGDIALLLKAITPAIAKHVLQQGTGNRSTQGLSALISEDQLQELFVESVRSGAHNNKLGLVKSVYENPQWPNTADGLDPQILDIPDVLVETDKTLWVFELKLNEIGIQSAHQVARYALNPACHVQANGRKIEAVAVGHRKSVELRNNRTHLAKEVEVTLWTYRWSEEAGLELVYD